jgi:hypothetical protein|tara:strand:+ start:100 stop:459 length:360 start_codon:yes stop_codon:yes gene_type:complete
MNTITIKVVAWEDDGQSLICKYASDETKSSNPDDYNAVAFQPVLMWPDATTQEAVLEQAARAGVSVCQEIKTYEDAADDPAKIAIYSGLVGQEQTFNYADIVPTPSSEGQQVDPDTIEV